GVSTRLTGLTTDTRYFVAVTAIDSGGNERACLSRAGGPPRGGYAAVVFAGFPRRRSGPGGLQAPGFPPVDKTGKLTATECRISPGTSVPATFAYQTTDPTTNEVIGTPNTPADIAPGGSQSYVFVFTPTAALASTDVVLTFNCTNAQPAPSRVGVNTLHFSASTTPIPDAIASAATFANDGILNLAKTGVFAVTTANLGARGRITVSADTGSAALPISIALCETDQATGQCANPTAPTTGPVVTTLDANAVT